MATLTSKRLVEAIDSQNSLDTAKVLQVCCDRGDPCRFQSIHNGYLAPAIFVALNPRGVELKLTVEVDDELPLPQSITCVSFSHHSKFCAFLGCVIDVSPVRAGAQHLVASVPQQLVATNLRQSFRVPVIEKAGLETMMQWPNQRWLSVEARDIAESGIEIECAASELPGLSVGTAVVIELRFRGETVQKSGQIRRMGQSRLGIAFDSATNEQEARRDAVLSRITLLLQQLWLKNRLT